MGFDNAMHSIDQGVAGLFTQWNGYTTFILSLFLGFLAYAVATQREPDTHPMLLARQADASRVRQQGESPVYRSQGAPHGMPLNAGLNVKEPGASKWSAGRNGDLRDIWRQAVAGVQEDNKYKGFKGRIYTVYGSENVIMDKIDDVTRHINLIGKHLQRQGGSKVAIYLPNSVELIVTLFACAFYDMTAIILPFDQPEDAVISMLRKSAADTVITVPGSFPFESVIKSYPSLKRLIWVVDEGSSHMEWDEVPKGMGGSVNVSTWQEIIKEQPAAAGKQLPSMQNQKEPRDVIIFWESKPGVEEEMVRFTAGNIVSAVAAQIFAIPTVRRINPTDLFVPADSLANSFTLVLTLAALHSNASIAFNSVAGKAADLSVAATGIRPTIIVASPATMLKTHAEVKEKLSANPITRMVHSWQTRSLTQGGSLRVTSPFTRYNDKLKPAIGTNPGSLRLLYIAERAGADTPPLPSSVLSDLRIFTGARVVYALTAAKVAGAVAQTGFYDYRAFEDKQGHFGGPLTCTEVWLKDSGEYRTTDERACGEIFVRGPSVSGGEAGLGVAGFIKEDNTLAYA